MYRKINKIGLSRLYKLEVPELVSSVIKIVDKYDPEALKIKTIFDLLVELEPQIQLLNVPYGPHPITAELEHHRSRRIALVNGIVNQVKAFDNGKIFGMQESIKVVKPVVKRYLVHLSRNNNEVITQTLTQFFGQIRTNLDLQEATQTLNLVKYLDELQDVNSVLEAHFDDRFVSLSERPKEKTAAIVKVVLEAMDKLFYEIDLEQTKNPELNYTPLIDELNVRLAHYGTLINKRASCNKRKADKTINDSEVVIDDESEESSEPARSTGRMYPMEVEVVNGENSGELDIIKTVAMSSNHNDCIIV